jgi:hypothetical protein
MSPTVTYGGQNGHKTAACDEPGALTRSFQAGAIKGTVPGAVASGGGPALEAELSRVCHAQ